MRTRTALLAMAVCAGLVAAPATATAQDPDGLTQVVPVTGKSKSGKTFRGTYAIDRFRSSHGDLFAVGTLRGRLGQRRVAARGVRCLRRCPGRRPQPSCRRSQTPARSSTWCSGR